MLNAALAILHDEHRSFAAIVHGLNYLVREAREKGTDAFQRNFTIPKRTPISLRDYVHVPMRRMPCLTSLNDSISMAPGWYAN